jgi:hypothetical protein
MKIIYNDNGLKILTPAIEIDIRILAEKDVPSGIMFKIIDDSEIPTDRTSRSAWTSEITEDNADGIGLTKEEFYAKYPQHKGWAVQ